MAASFPAGAATVIGEVVSHYRVDRRLGEGGMGVVYLFSFGAVLYEMATGRRAFVGSSANEAIDAVILQALEKDRDARCPSATKMLETFRSLQADSRRGADHPGVFRLIRGLLARTPPSFTSARTLDAEPARAEPRPASPEMRRSWSVEIPESRWPFVARAAERAELGQRLEEALAGRGSLVLVGGEPGIGKTRLAEEILREGRARGAVAFLGHCSEMEGAPPYAPCAPL